MLPIEPKAFRLLRSSFGGHDPNSVIRIFDAGSGQIAALPGSVGQSDPRWSPDARSIAANSSGQTIMMNIFDVGSEPCWAQPERFGTRSGLDQAPPAQARQKAPLCAGLFASSLIQFFTADSPSARPAPPWGGRVSDAGSVARGSLGRLGVVRYMLLRRLGILVVFLLPPGFGCVRFTVPACPVLPFVLLRPFILGVLALLR